MPQITGLELGDGPAAWAALGFQVRDGRCRVGGVTLELTGAGGPIRGWILAGGPGPAALDGLPTRWDGAPADGDAPAHPVGAVGIDHVVVLTDSQARTSGALAAAGAEVRRISEPPKSRVRQAFHRLGEVIVEVVETGEGPPRFWGLAIVVSDLEAAAAALGDAVGPPRAAVQPGRRIATVRREAGLGAALALMTPHVKGSNPARAAAGRPEADARPGPRYV